MNIILDHRQTGKTLKLIKRSIDTGGVMVVANHNSLDNCYRLIEKHGLDKSKFPNPINYQEFIGMKYYGKIIHGFIIDNAELLLQSISSVRIDTISLSMEDIYSDE